MKTVLDSRARFWLQLALLVLALTCDVTASRSLVSSEDSDGIPECVERIEKRGYKGVDGGEYFKQYGNMRRCYKKCNEEADIMVWDEKEGKCRCWKAADGEWDETDVDDSTVYDMRPCYAAPTPSAGTEELPVDGSATRSAGAADSVAPANSDTGGSAVALLAPCVTRSDGRTYQSRGVGTYQFSSSRLDTCVNTCFQSSDIIVWNTLTRACECWSAVDGQWVISPDNVSFDLRVCRSQDGSPKLSAGVADTRAPTNSDTSGGAAALLAPCVTRTEGRSYQSRGLGNYQLSSDRLDTCVNSCFQASDIIVWNTLTRACQCWAAVDGQWVINPDIVSFDLRACRSQTSLGLGTSRSVGNAVPAAGSTGWSELVVPGSASNGLPQQSSQQALPSFDRFVSIDDQCMPGMSQRWTDFFNAACIGTNLKTIPLGYLIFSRDSTPGALIPGVQQYDGSMAMCKAMFEMKQNGTLVNQDIFVGANSWLSWDSTARTCRIYETNDACSALEYSPATKGRIAARFCP